MNHAALSSSSIVSGQPFASIVRTVGRASGVVDGVVVPRIG